MARPIFSGVITALVTPFHDDGSVDLDSYRKLCRSQIADGVSALVPMGTTGESVTVDDEEHTAIVKTCVEECRGKVPVIAGAGGNDTKKASAMHKKIAQLGADGSLQVTPYYNKPTQEGLYRHFRAVAESNPLPIVLYNVPGRTGVDMLPETVARLAKDCPTIVAVKEATGSVARAQEIINRVERDDFAIFSGDDGLILGLLAVGGHGVISVTSHLCANDLAKMVKAWNDGRIAEAQALAKKTSPLASILFFRTSPIPVKTALAWRGMVKKSFRLPLCPLDDAEEAQLKKMLTGAGYL